MPAFQPTADQFRALRDDPHDGPLSQVNLLKFKIKAEYQPSDPEYGDGATGQEAYFRYSEALTPIGAELGGTTTLLGVTERYFIGEGDWDAVLINTLPSRQAFIKMLNHPDYKSFARHREAGLLCQELIVTRPARLHGEKL